MSVNHGDARGAARSLAAALSLGVLLVARAASAWTYPLLPHVHGLAFFPETPNSSQPTSILLSAVYPNECWRLAGGQLIDSAHVRVTVAAAHDCGDSVSTWTAGWELGVLAAGMHSLTVHCTVLDGSATPGEEEITVPFEVVQGWNGPPPPPEPAPSILLGYEVSPPEPRIGDAVSLRLWGREPFECTLARDANVLDREHVEITFERQDACADTSRRWEHTFAMGVYDTAGDFRVDVAFHLVAPESLVTLHAGALIHVTDPDAPPPPPPPPGPEPPVALLSDYEVSPPEPTVGVPVSLRLWGREPFECTSTRYSTDLDTGHVEVTFEWQDACADTSRRWEHTFELGAFAAAGGYRVDITFHVVSPESTHIEHAGALVHVSDPNAPPPPPPGDSLRATLSASHPNPFSERTDFAVSLAEPAPAEVAVFDLGGRLVATLHRGMLPRGTSNLAWDGRRRDGSRAPGGIYFYRLTLPGRVMTRRVVLLSPP